MCTTTERSNPDDPDDGTLIFFSSNCVFLRSPKDKDFCLHFSII